MINKEKLFKNNLMLWILIVIMLLMPIFLIIRKNYFSDWEVVFRSTYGLSSGNTQFFLTQEEFQEKTKKLPLLSSLIEGQIILIMKDAIAADEFMIKSINVEENGKYSIWGNQKGDFGATHDISKAVIDNGLEEIKIVGCNSNDKEEFWWCQQRQAKNPIQQTEVMGGYNFYIIKKEDILGYSNMNNSNMSATSGIQQ